MELSVEKCPLCTDQSPSGSQYDTWLQCDACSTWYHAYCLNISAVDCDNIETYHCPTCLSTHGPSTLKPQPRKSKRDSIRLNYADMNEGLTGDEKIWGKVLNSKTFAADRFKRYTGSQVNLGRFRKHGLKEPFVIEHNENLGMKMPSCETTVMDISKAVGEDRPVEVIDVATQSDCPGWTMGKWAEYYSNPDRDRIRNVISLEISGTAFANDIVRPQLVRDMDWIDHMWPEDLRPKEYPKVQLYCLMGTKDSYTDFHIDFGGTSVFYHIIRGSKVFYFIEPTSKNLKKYQKWSSSPEQSATFLGDEVKTCHAVHLKAGNTMIIPTGWIHAVYTPEDALVIGGNFLHGLNIGTQLRVFDIEEATNVPTKFRFPYFKRINWYAAQKYNDLLQVNPQSLSIFELQGIMDLARWLQNDVFQLDDESISSQERKMIRADIPPSVDDPSHLIRSLIHGVEKAISGLSKEKKKKSSKSLSASPHTASTSTSYVSMLEEKDRHSDQTQQQKVVKLKLKLAQKVDDQHRSNNDDNGDDEGPLLHTTALQSQLPNDIATSHSHQQPKLLLKLKQQQDQVTNNELAHMSDDGEYVLEDNELATGEDDQFADDSDDFEYQEEDDHDEFRPQASFAPKPSIVSRRSTTTTRKRARKVTTANTGVGFNNGSDSSSDDDMGTSKRVAGSSSLVARRHALGNRAKSSSSATSTVKQRLLDRIIKR